MDLPNESELRKLTEAALEDVLGHRPWLSHAAKMVRADGAHAAGLSAIPAKHH